MPEQPVGKTRDTGWQIGVSRTLLLPVEEAWPLLVSPPGMVAWLGEAHALSKGAAFRLADDTACQVTIFKPDSHLRMSWFPSSYPRAAVLQVRVTQNVTGTRIAFMQQHLPNQAAREARLAYYRAAMERIEALL